MLIFKRCFNSIEITVENERIQNDVYSWNNYSLFYGDKEKKYLKQTNINEKRRDRESIDRLFHKSS